MQAHEGEGEGNGYDGCEASVGPLIGSPQSYLCFSSSSTTASMGSVIRSLILHI